MARNPSVVVAGRTLIVAGNDIRQYDDEPIRKRRLTVWLGSRAVDPPPGDFLFAYPLVVYEPATRQTHLFWAEGVDRPRVPSLLYHDLDAVWWSFRGPNTEDGWSPPARIYRSDAVTWFPHGTDATIGPDGALHLAVGAARQNKHYLVHLRLERGRWSALEIPTLSRVGYPAVAVDGTHVLVAFQGWDSGTTSNFNSVLVVRSMDGGRTFGQSQLVSAHGDRGAHWMRAFKSPAGGFHLVWSSDTDGGNWPERLTHSETRDGVHWSPETALELTEGFSSPQMTIDRYGTIHGVFDHWSGSGPGHVDHVCWNGAWSRHHVLTDVPALNPGLAVDSTGTLHLVVHVRNPPIGNPATFRTVTSSSRPSVPRGR